MTDVTMTMNARENFAVRVDRERLVQKIAVTIQARVLRHTLVARLDLNWFVKVVQRER